MNSTTTPTTKPWLDLRDGPPPENFFAFLRYTLDRTTQAISPPLRPIDVLMLSGQAVAARYFYPVVPRIGSPRMDKYAYFDICGVHCALVAHRDYADKANILWAPSPRDQIDIVMSELARWANEVQASALGGPWCATPDTSARGREIKRQTELIFQGAFKPNYTSLIHGLDRAVAKNVGGNEWDARNIAELSPDERREWFKLIAEQTEFSMDSFAFNEDEMGFSVAGAGELLAEFLPKGVGLDSSLLSLDVPVSETSDEGTLGDAVSAEREQSPVDAAAVVELRELRDVHDLGRAHPLLDSLADIASRTGNADAFGDLITRLMPILDATADRATVAAVVYELGSRTGGGWGTWSREQVADSYGVSIRQLERRASAAKQLIDRVLAS